MMTEKEKGVIEVRKCRKHPELKQPAVSREKAPQ